MPTQWRRTKHPGHSCKTLYMLPQVFQVRKKNSGRIYAMKVMRKDRILARDHSEYVRAERDVLTAVHHPYVVTLRYSFQVRRLYLSWRLVTMLSI